jgi:hypothetical protein
MESYWELAVGSTWRTISGMAFVLLPRRSQKLFVEQHKI